MCRQQALLGCNGVISLRRHTQPSLLLIGLVRIIIDIDIIDSVIVFTHHHVAILNYLAHPRP